MKLLALLFLIISTSVNAQTDYESPYVYEGKSFKMTFPAGYYELPNVNGRKGTVLSQDSTLDANFMDGPPEVNTIAMFYLDEITPGEDLTEFFNDEIRNDNQTTLLDEPTFKKLEGAELASFTANVDGDKMTLVYAGILHFGEYRIMMMLLPSSKEITKKDKSDFESMVSSLTIISTDRENEYIVGEANEPVDFMVYKNSMIETELAYESIYFSEEDNDSGWNEDWDNESMERYLIAYRYLLDNEDGTNREIGKFSAFSSGKLSNTPDLASKQAALQKVYPELLISKLSVLSTFESKKDEIEITEYDFISNTKGANSAISIYSCEYKEELVFFVVEASVEDRDKFLEISKRFVSSVWFFDEEELMEYLEKE